MAPPALAALLLAAVAVFRFYLWPPVAQLLEHAPAEFTDAFAELVAREQAVVFRSPSSPGSPRCCRSCSAAWIRRAPAFSSSASPRSFSPQSYRRALRARSRRRSCTPRRELRTSWCAGTAGSGCSSRAPPSRAVAFGVAQRLPATSTRVGVLDDRHRRLIVLLGAATLFEGYDRFIISLALPYIGHDLGASEGSLGFALSIIRVGALMSLFLGRAADRFGRRRVLLTTVLAYTIATAATGLSHALAAFVVFQLLATVFLTAELALAQVVVAEEFPASYRGRGQGLLGAFGALGGGLAAMLFPVLARSAVGWRGLYFLGLVPLLFVAYLRRDMPETRRWRRLAEARLAMPRPVDVRALAELLGRDLRVRFLALNLAAASASIAASPAFAFASYHATHAFDWSPSEVSAMIIAGGALGVSGWFFFGRLADSFGRRGTGAVALVFGAVSAVAFYQTSWLVPAFAALVFTDAGASIALNALGTELFPTHLRATAKSWVTNSAIVGAMVGLAIVGLASARFGAAAVISTLAIVQLLSTPLLFLVRETRGEELEAIAGDELEAVIGDER
jgi:putative MFS transporter